MRNPSACLFYGGLLLAYAPGTLGHLVRGASPSDALSLLQKTPNDDMVDMMENPSEGLTPFQLKAENAKAKAMKTAKYKKLVAWNPLIAYLFKKGFIGEFVTQNELYEAFVDYLNMARTDETRAIFAAGWEVMALDYKICIFDMPQQWLVNPGVTPETFFKIRKMFASSKKVYKREARMITDWFFYEDKMDHVAQAKLFRIFSLPFTLLWNFVVDNPVTSGLRLKLPVDRAWSFWPMLVEIFGKEEQIFVPDPAHPGELPDGTRFYNQRAVKYLDWIDLENLYLKADIPPLPKEPWGLKEFVYSLLN